MCRIVCVLLLFTLFSLVPSKPIMVTYGTNQGPITPVEQPTTTIARIAAAHSAPAPVFEKPDDIPNPSIYRPLIPHQYRRKIHSHRPHPNLLLGTPVDIKFTPRFDKRKDLKRQIKALGIGYTGPQIFEKQDYEYELERNKNRSFAERRESGEFGSRSSEETARSTYQHGQKNLVPQIGVVYSSGLRYYIPQLVDHSHSEEDSNSVYDRNDSRYETTNYQQQRQQRRY